MYGYKFIPYHYILDMIRYFNICIPTIEVSKIKETNNFLNYKFRTLSVNSFLGEKHFVSRCRTGCFSVRNGALVLKENPE